MKLGLGTAQFGMPYGVANKGTATSQEEIERILDAAADAGIALLDTAALYEDSERRLGEALRGRTHFRIVTKSPAFSGKEIGATDGEALRATCMRSLERLRQDRVYGLLIHHANDLLKPGAEVLTRALRGLVREGLLEKIGVSVYTAAELDAVLDVFEPGLVQLPLNVFDQRFVASGRLGRLKRLGIEVHARSIFLQGVLLMEPHALPQFLAPLRDNLEDYSEALRAHRMSRVNGALTFIRQVDAVNYAIVGVQSLHELEELADVSGAPENPDFDFRRFAVADEDLILPPRWKLDDA